VLAEGGIAYTISDVKDLHEWMDSHFKEHPLFEKVSNEELEKDPVVPVVYNQTEEGKKVAKSQGQKYLAVFRKKKTNVSSSATSSTTTTTTTTS